MTSLKIKRAAEEIVRKLDLGLGADGIRENERRIEEILARHFALTLDPDSLTDALYEEWQAEVHRIITARKHDRGHTQAP